MFPLATALTTCVRFWAKATQSASAPSKRCSRRNCWRSQDSNSTRRVRPCNRLTNVALLSRHFGFWSLDFWHVIDVFEARSENGGAILRSGFAYGTLPGHAVRGEEIFSIEWHPAREKVWYDIYSFSLPANFLTSRPISSGRFDAYSAGNL